MFAHFFLHGLIATLIAKTVHISAETFDEVFTECESNVRNRILCYCYNGSILQHGIRTLSVRPTFSRKDCFIVLRAKVLKEYQGMMAPPIYLTVAVNFGDASSGQQLYITFAFMKNDSKSSVGIRGVRTSDGRLTATMVQQLADAISLRRLVGPILGRYELHGNENTIILSYLLPSDGIQFRRNVHSYDQFVKAFIIARYRTQPIVDLFLPEGHKDEIFHHRGHLYSSCDERTTRCLTSTDDSNQQCLNTSSCNRLVKIMYIPNNLVILNVNREVTKQNSAYFSVGFSPNNGMGDTLVFDCIKNALGTSSSGLSYNDGHQNVILQSAQNIPSTNRVGWSNLLQCSWNLTYTHNYSTQGTSVNLSKNAYHILMALGNLTDISAIPIAVGSKNKHTLKASSGTRLNITPTAIYDLPAVNPPPTVVTVTVTVTESTKETEKTVEETKSTGISRESKTPASVQTVGPFSTWLTSLGKTENLLGVALLGVFATAVSTAFLIASAWLLCRILAPQKDGGERSRRSRPPRRYRVPLGQSRRRMRPIRPGS